MKSPIAPRNLKGFLPRHHLSNAPRLGTTASLEEKLQNGQSVCSQSCPVRFWHCTTLVVTTKESSLPKDHAILLQSV